MLTDEFMLTIARETARWFELAGIAVIVIGAAIAVARCMLAHFGMGDGEQNIVKVFRRRLGLAILTGLEILVAADIIRTVAVEPTLDNLLVLGLIVLIRTFLSISLEMEVEGRWPWQQARTDTHPNEM